ncbi:MAG: bifunctional proline dehydrogenase/L-glutamate gamma-semialdehyde dehydrogenase PutA [Steroidobacteraceae bacterium]
MNAFLFPGGDVPTGEVERAVNSHFLADEASTVMALMGEVRLSPADTEAVAAAASALVETVRRERAGAAGIEAFLQEYDLASREGVVLMCLAEALLRIPDDVTADRLIADKIASGDWAGHLGEAESLFVNASTWGLLLTGRLIRPELDDLREPASFVQRLAGRLGEPVVRAAFRQAMKIMGHQFVMGRDIGSALQRAGRERRYRHTFDMLGEAALTALDAERYHAAYAAAIDAIGAVVARSTAAVEDRPSISVKLSALYPRYERAHREDVLDALGARLEDLALRAARLGVPLTVDAEEADRLTLSLELVERLLRSPALGDWDGLGLAVQAYQKRALAVLDWLDAQSNATGRRLSVRLVKGADWASEIKRAQERGLQGYPVFTRKVNTDLSYLACARRLLRDGCVLRPQFATHNAHTVAWIMRVAGGRSVEFQRLHGMGEDLYDGLVDGDGRPVPCRVYAPVGSHEELLPYLVRRLLENGANTSFVNRIVDAEVPAAEVVRDPLQEAGKLASIPHPRIPLPSALFGEERQNSAGINLADGVLLAELATGLARASGASFRAVPIVSGREQAGPARAVLSPADTRLQVGEVIESSHEMVDEALSAACRAQPAWNRRPAAERADILLAAARLFESNRDALLALCIREAGKTLPDALAELREAVDFLRYYAQQARREFGQPEALPGPTGESNRLQWEGRGLFVCISPWNFPLAIFTGQVAAALAAGNAVIAKPAEQTPLVAALAVRLMLEAGVPAEVLHFLPGEGAVVGARLTADPRVDGVAFTGSTETARLINRALAARDAPLAALIAETGGQNAMIVDSSALVEQVVGDVIASAFNAAGQRCSALRVLFLQEDIADLTLRRLAGAMDLLRVGDPAMLATDVGPVIDSEARRMLETHAERVLGLARWSHRVRVGDGCEHGHFFAPLAVEIPGLEVLQGEVFGPVLHVIRFEARALDAVIASINGTGYGLTLGVHSRVDGFARRIAGAVRAGNVYVNRNMIGAVVGVQPFGGCGLSGTGPKAGGPHYLHRFANERTVTVNTTAAGGNASLLSLGD